MAVLVKRTEMNEQIHLGQDSALMLVFFCTEQSEAILVLESLRGPCGCNTRMCLTLLANI